MADTPPTSPEFNITVDALALAAKKNGLNTIEADRIVAKAKREKNAGADLSMTFPNEEEYQRFLGELAHEPDGTKKVGIFTKALAEKLKITLTTAQAVGEVRADTEIQKTIDDALKALKETPDATKVEQIIKVIDDDKTMTPEKKKEVYERILDVVLFSKGFGYRFDLSKVVDSKGNVDEPRTTAIAKVGTENIRFAMFTKISALHKNANGDITRMVNSMASKYTIILTNDPVQNRQAIHNSTIPEPEKSWLISYSHNQDSIKVSKPDVDAASKLSGQKARDAEGARDEVAKHTNKSFKWPSAEEIARDPSIVMTSALQALGPTGVAAGIFTLIFSKWIFNNNWTGFDLVAKVGAAFFGAKLAGKLGLGQALYDEATGNTTHARDTGKAAVEAGKVGLTWALARLNESWNATLAKGEEVGKKIEIWYRMSNYSVLEGGNRVAFDQAKVATLSQIDPTNTHTLGIQKEGDPKKVDKGDLSYAKTTIDGLKTKRIVNLVAGGKSQPDATTQVAQEMQQMNILEFTIKATDVPTPPTPVPAAPAAPAPAVVPGQPAGRSLSQLGVAGSASSQPAPQPSSLSNLSIAKKV